VAPPDLGKRLRYFALTQNGFEMTNSPPDDDKSEITAALERAVAELRKSLNYGSSREKLWEQVAEPIRKEVEQHVAAPLPAGLLAKWRDRYARGERIGSDQISFHFSAGWPSGTCPSQIIRLS